jgi:hypothetical protein
MKMSDVGDATDAISRRWRVYDGKEPLGAFLERNSPSKLSIKDTPWIKVSYEQEQQEDEELEEESEDEDEDGPSLMTEWEDLVKNKHVKMITQETLTELAVKYKYTSGKWMLFGSRFVEIIAVKIIVIKNVKSSKVPEDNFICIH